MDKDTYSLPDPINIGTFKLRSDTGSIALLLKKLEENAPAAFQASGMRPAYFFANPAIQAAVLKYDDEITTWLICIQFVRAPSETGKTVEAYVTSLRAVSVPGDPEFIYHVKDQLFKCLKKAQVM